MKKNHNKIVNMKKSILPLIMSFLFFMAANAQGVVKRDDNFFCYEDSCYVDETNVYAKIFSGANFLQNTTIENTKTTYETGYVIAASLGYYLPCGLSLEAEYAFREDEIRQIDFFGQGFSNNGYFQTSSCMVNLCSWGCLFGNIKSFIGAGIGCDFQKMHSSNSRIVFDQEWNYFSWQAMTGLVYPVSCNTEATLEYKFHQGGYFNNHSIGVGLVYNLDFLR